MPYEYIDKTAKLQGCGPIQHSTPTKSHCPRCLQMASQPQCANAVQS